MPDPEVPVSSDILASIQDAGWHLGKFIGEGGGARVFLCLKHQTIELLEGAINFARGHITQSDSRQFAFDFLNQLYHLSLPGNPFLGAVKIPKQLEDPNALARFKREIQALQVVNHPNLINAYEFDRNDPPRWLLMEYHPRGTLETNKSLFRGQPHRAIEALRPVVEAVAVLHRHPSKFVHRDIKPKNIFLNLAGNLVLGDLGIVFPNDDTDGERLTLPGTTEPFSRDWIPDWVRFRTLDDYGPCMDVHMLGKVLYFMVSGGRYTSASLIDDEDFDLTKQFPNAEGMPALYSLLKTCITVKQRDCVPKDASEFHSSLGEVARSLDNNQQPQLVFSLLLKHSGSQLYIPMTGGKGPKVIFSTAVYLGAGHTKLFGRARVIRPFQNAMVTLEIFLKGLTSTPVKITGHDLGEDDWSRPMELMVDSPLEEGWYQLKLFGESTRGQSSLEAISIYAR